MDLVTMQPNIERIDNNSDIAKSFMDGNAAWIIEEFVRDYNTMCGYNPLELTKEQAKLKMQYGAKLLDKLVANKGQGENNGNTQIAVIVKGLTDEQVKEYSR